MHVTVARLDEDMHKEVIDQPRPRVVPESYLTVAALILAAGTSSRFGQHNKLLSRFLDETLLHHVVNACDRSNVDKMSVITGHEHELVEAALPSPTSKTLERIHNDAYHTGMAGSLVCGVSSLIDVDAIVVCLGDMPKVTPAVINALVRAFCEHPHKAIYVPTFFGQRGNPVLIARRLFDSVLSLQGDTGARLLVRQFPETVMEVDTDCPGILQDIDTQEALVAFRTLHGSIP